MKSGLLGLITRHPLATLAAILLVGGSKETSKASTTTQSPQAPKDAPQAKPDASPATSESTAKVEVQGTPFVLVFALDPSKAKTVNAIRRLKNEKGKSFKVPITNDIAKDFNSALQGVWVGRLNAFAKSNVSIPIPGDETVLVYMEPKASIPNFPGEADEATPEYYGELLKYRADIFNNLPVVADILNVSEKVKMPSSVFIIKPEEKA